MEKGPASPADSPPEFRRIVRNDQIISLTDIGIKKMIDLYHFLKEILS